MLNILKTKRLDAPYRQFFVGVTACFYVSAAIGVRCQCSGFRIQHLNDLTPETYNAFSAKKIKCKILGRLAAEIAVLILSSLFSNVIQQLNNSYKPITA